MSRSSALLTGALLAALLLPIRAAAQPLGASFTYQGELGAAGAIPAGPHDFRFRLFDAPTGGSQVGTTLCADNVEVTGGRFTVSLDFGPQFNGSQRFLEIDVRADALLSCAEPGGFTTLLPRQPLTPAPYAAYALAAETASSAVNAARFNGQTPAFYQDASNLTAGTIPGARLGGMYSNPVAFTSAANIFQGTFTGTGEGLTGLNASEITIGTLGTGVLPNPFTLVGISPTCIITATNASNAANSAGVCGMSTALTGNTYGVIGQSDSSTGTGVFGETTSASGGVAIGVYGNTFSQTGRGVFGASRAGTGPGLGGVRHFVRR